MSGAAAAAGADKNMLTTSQCARTTTARQTDRQTDRHTASQTDRQPYRQKDRQTDCNGMAMAWQWQRNSSSVTAQMQSVFCIFYMATIICTFLISETPSPTGTAASQRTQHILFGEAWRSKVGRSRAAPVSNLRTSTRWAAAWRRMRRRSTL
jgi:hypothetical protein